GKSVSGTVTGPGHRRHRHPVPAAVHPRRVGLQEDPHHAVVEVPPPTSAPPRVEPGRRAPAPAAPLPTARIGPYRHDHTLFVLIHSDALDHGVLRRQGPLPYPEEGHAVFLFDPT